MTKRGADEPGHDPCREECLFDRIRALLGMTAVADVDTAVIEIVLKNGRPRSLYFDITESFGLNPPASPGGK